ncbi:hypothetical protein Tco_1233804 [Tanacetum coccineum]
MLYEYFNPLSSVVSHGFLVVSLQVADITSTPLSTHVDQYASSSSTSSTTQETQSLVLSQDVEERDLVNTLMVDITKLDEDLQGTPVDPTHYRGTPNMGLWYLKDTDIALTAYADADHAKCQDTRRSTSSSAQFLGNKLVSWSSKKQKITAISNIFTKALARERFEFLINWLGMKSMSQETLKSLAEEKEE